eukprot:7574182-Alexandrium_andersonii.AAC.1
MCPCGSCLAPRAAQTRMRPCGTAPNHATHASPWSTARPIRTHRTCRTRVVVLHAPAPDHATRTSP